MCVLVGKETPECAEFCASVVAHEGRKAALELKSVLNLQACEANVAFLTHLATCSQPRDPKRICRFSTRGFYLRPQQQLEGASCSNYQRYTSGRGGALSCVIISHTMKSHHCAEQRTPTCLRSVPADSPGGCAVWQTFVPCVWKSTHCQHGREKLIFTAYGLGFNISWRR